MKHKKVTMWAALLSALLLLSLASPSAMAQNNPSLQGTNSASSGGDWLQNIGNAISDIGISSPTNFAVAPFVDYVPSAPQKWGGGVMGFWNVSQNVGIGAGGEYIGSQFLSLNTQLQLKTTIKPLSFMGDNWLGNMKMTPYGVAGALTPLQGAGSSNLGVVGVAGAGAVFDICSVGGGELFAGGGYAYWSTAGAYGGNHYQGIFGWRIGF